MAEERDAQEGEKNRMKIGIDCSLAPGERVGVGQYSYNLARALSRIDRKNTYLLYPVFYHIFHREYKKAGLPEGGNFKVKFKHIPEKMMRFIWKAEPWPLTREFLLGDVDLVHSTTFCVPGFRDGKKRLVVTVYDVSFITHPECHMQANIDHCLTGTREAVERADAIIAISKHTKKDLVEYFGAPEEKVTVTRLAAGGSFRRVEDANAAGEIRRKYGLPQGFVLFLGSLEPRKNVKTLFRAYSMLPKKARDKARLVIAGGKGWLNNDIKTQIEEFGISGQTCFTGYVAQEDLPAIYSMASVFVYPSLYEGFGLPILEAMGCGCPVITSNVSSMPEVAGDAGVLIDPFDAHALSKAIQEVLADEGLRARLSAAGIERAKQFSWEKTARETLEVYNKVVRG
jgi:glycosyltransferase involved in cell wall biosynthesis